MQGKFKLPRPKRKRRFPHLYNPSKGRVPYASWTVLKIQGNRWPQVMTGKASTCPALLVWGCGGSPWRWWRGGTTGWATSWSGQEGKWARRVCEIVVRRVSLLVETEENGLVLFLKEHKQHKTCMDKYPTSTYLTCIISGTWISRKPKSVFQRRWVHKASQTLRGCQAGDVEMESKGACDDFLWKQSCDEKNPWIKNHWNGPGDLIHLLRIGNKSVEEINVFQNSFGECDHGSRFKICF